MLFPEHTSILKRLRESKVKLRGCWKCGMKTSGLRLRAIDEDKQKGKIRSQIKN